MKRHLRHHLIGALAVGAAAGAAALAMPGPVVASGAAARMVVASTTAPATTAPATTSATPRPTTPAPKVRPAIRAVLQASTVTYGSKATVTYTVTAAGVPWAGKPVRIGTALTGKPVVYSDTTTDENGTVALTREATGRFEVRLIVSATDTSLEASAASTVMVGSKAELSAPGNGQLRVILWGANGQTVQVQRSDGGRWLPAKTYVAKLALYTATGLTPGQYRIVVPTSTAITGLISEPVVVA